jgi:hypothetical protein
MNIGPSKQASDSRISKRDGIPDPETPEGQRQIESDFSLTLGGPLYQLYLRTRLAREPLELLVRRATIVPLVCWVPLFVLSIATGRALGGVPVPFLFDLEVHTRFLAGLPLLIIAELMVHQRINVIVRQFLNRKIVVQQDRRRFDAIMASTMRMRNSVLWEALLLVLCFTIGHWVWREHLTMRVTTWYAGDSAAGPRLNAAGYWYAFVSLPIFRFILLRWYFRLFLWYQFLWRVRGLPLHLNLFHPDKAGGLGFLGASILAFSPVLVAHTTFLAGLIGDRIWHAGATLPSFKMQIVASLLFLMALVLLPLSFFVVHLGRARRTAVVEYGTLASRYVDDFRQKWIKKPSEDTEPLLGTSDIQSLADLGNAFNVISDIHLLPYGKQAIIRLGVLLVVPLLPLTLTIVPLKQIIDLLLKLAF